MRCFETKASEEIQTTRTSTSDGLKKKQNKMESEVSSDNLSCIDRNRSLSYQSSQFCADSFIRAMIGMFNDQSMVECCRTFKKLST